METPNKAEHIPGPVPTGIVLYQWSHCPYCVRVREAFDGMGLAYDVVEVGRSQQEVFDLVGIRQVPAITDSRTGVAMVESLDIIAYAASTYGPAAAWVL